MISRRPPLPQSVNSPGCTTGSSVGSGALVVHLFSFDRIENWVQSLEFHSGVGGGELPVDPHLLSVAVTLPGGDFAWQGGEVWHATVETRPSQYASLDLRHVEPTAVLGCVVSLQLVDQPPRLLRG